MTTVLVPLDADENRTQRQVDALTALSLGAEVEVLLLHVYEPVDAPGMDMAGSSIADINEALEDLQGLRRGLRVLIDILRVVDSEHACLRGSAGTPPR